MSWVRCGYCHNGSIPSRDGGYEWYRCSYCSNGWVLVEDKVGAKDDKSRRD